MIERAIEIFSELQPQTEAIRLQIALYRDSLLTEAEQLAMLEVYREFGR
jgi:hypothetical protein